MVEQLFIEIEQPEVIFEQLKLYYIQYNTQNFTALNYLIEVLSPLNFFIHFLQQILMVKCIGVAQCYYFKIELYTGIMLNSCNLLLVVVAHKMKNENIYSRQIYHGGTNRGPRTLDNASLDRCVVSHHSGHSEKYQPKFHSFEISAEKNENRRKHENNFSGQVKKMSGCHKKSRQL